MKRIWILCLVSERDATLERLARLGAVQVEETGAGSPEFLAADGAVAAAEAAAADLAEAASARDPLSLSLRLPHGPPPEGRGAVAMVLAVAKRWTDARAEADALEAKVAKYVPWGSFDPRKARELEADGVPFALFSVTPRDFEGLAFPETGVLTVVSRGKDRVCGAFAGAPLPEGVAAFPLPDEPLAETRRKLEEARAAMRTAAGTLKTLGRLADEVRAAAEVSSERREWAAASESLREEGPVAYLCGWIPGPALRDLEKAARAGGWGFAARDPLPEEEPPVLVRVPRAFRPIQALFKALGIMPGYRESDPSAVFYSFFTLFFAMLVGDAGYGALMLAAWHFLRRSMRRKAAETGVEPSEFASQGMSLLLVFGAAATAWGVLSGTYFGMPAEWLPAPLASDLPTARWLSVQSNVMHLCFVIGLAHLGIARVWNAAELWPDRKALAQIGWLGVLYGMYNVVCTIVVTDFRYPAGATWSIAAGVALILLFSYRKDELKANAVSLAMTPLNVVSSMGDVISYVRLFAVGLASVQIARTFDTMAAGLAMPLWAKVPCMAAILLLGHALNLAMGALSILVHAVRLNTLEFSSAKGITWSGTEYSPFKARKNPENPDGN
ncbi:MAG: hypothetical protein IJ783_01165 [Kiritimatiellae bacterium]|nr:hypothetical protein [Kiritimatiellia bacterium]